MGVQPPNFSWVLPGRLAGLALPRLPAHYQFLLDLGVRHLVSLTERGPPHSDSCPDLTLHRLRIPDFCPPAPEQIDRFVQIVDEANARGEVSGRGQRREERPGSGPRGRGRSWGRLGRECGAGAGGGGRGRETTGATRTDSQGAGRGGEWEEPRGSACDRLVEPGPGKIGGRKWGQTGTAALRPRIMEPTFPAAAY